MKVVSGNIHKAKRGKAKSKEYNCFSPAMTGDFKIVDCFVCNNQGEVCPGMETPVPVYTSDLGQIVGVME